MRTALLGFGLAGEVFHAPLIDTTADLQLRAIVTSDPQRQARASTAYPQADILPDAAAIFTAASDYDLVVVATPNRSHVSLARAALNSGLATVVDKPLAATPQEGLELVRLARERGLLLTVFHNRRWDSDFLTLQKLLADNALGAVHRFEGRFERWRPQIGQSWRESANPADVGGVMFDLGSHLVDQALLLFGAVSHVYAERDVRRAGAVIDDDAFIALTHRSGVRSHLWMSAVSASGAPRMRVLGAKASYVKHGLDRQEDLLKQSKRPGEAWGEEPPERWGRLEFGNAQQAVRSEGGGYQAFYTALARALRDGGPAPVDPLDAIAGLAVLNAAAASAQRGAVVAIDELSGGD